MARTAAPTCASLYGRDVLLEEVDQASLLLQKSEQAQGAVSAGISGRAGRSRVGGLARTSDEGDQQREQDADQERCAAEEPDPLRPLGDGGAERMDQPRREIQFRRRRPGELLHHQRVPEDVAGREQDGEEQDEDDEQSTGHRLIPPWGRARAR